MSLYPTREGGVTGAGAYHLVATAGRFRWTHDRREVASAVWREHCWDLFDGPGGPVMLSLVGGSVDGHTRVALIDHLGRVTSTFASAEPMSREHIGMVRDSFGAIRMVVRADGPTGLHVIDAAGEVLALTSRRRPPEGHGCDLLVTAEGAAVGTHLLFGLTLALELLRAGRLRLVA